MLCQYSYRVASRRTRELASSWFIQKYLAKMPFATTLHQPLSFPKVAGFATAAALSSYFLLKKFNTLAKQQCMEKQRTERLVVITGCDTGLGYSMAVWASTLGYKVLAGCLNENGEGPQKLLKEFPERIILQGLNVTDRTSLQNFYSVCAAILETSQQKLELWALIANAAVCTMGEFFWQTQRQKEYQMDVNFWGTVNFITDFRELLLKSKARVMIISSDCSDYPLPFLSTYCASKAALNNWTQAFRFEVRKYGVHVVAYQPRDFAQRSGLFSNLELQYKQMSSEMSDFDRRFYGEYFDNFMKKKQEIFRPTKTAAINVLNSRHHQNSFIFLLENDISRISVFKSFSYLENIFHGLYKILPQSYLDKMVVMLLNPDSKIIQWKRT